MRNNFDLFRHSDCITSDTVEPFLMHSPNSSPVLFRLADKELQRKSLEDSLNAERSSGASRETNMQVYLQEHFSYSFLY